MSDTQRDSIRRIIREKFGLLSDIAIIGDGTGRIYNNLRPGYVWVRQEQTIAENGTPIYTPPFEVRHHPNAIYKVVDGTRVNLFIDRDGNLAIEGQDFDSTVVSGGNPAVLNPAEPFTKFVNPDQLSPLRSFAIATTTQPTLKVGVQALLYITDNNTYNFFAGGQYDFTSDVPATSGKKALACLHLTASNTLDAVVGSDKDEILPFAPADISEAVGLMPSTAIPIALWVLTNGMTTITDKQLYLDLRQWMNMPTPASTIETFPITITETITIPAGEQKVIGRTTVGVGGKLIANGRIRVV